MLKASTIQHLRFHFSFFLMPIYLFALSQVVTIDVMGSVLCFIILHVLVYPASNAYNSHQDRDTGSIGLIKNPLKTTDQILWVSLIMNIAAILLALFISIYFAGFVALYILASTLYSYRKVRIKQYAVPGFLLVFIFQGAFTYYMCKHACSTGKPLYVSAFALIGSSCLVGAFYPLSQIYQHKQDAADGVKTLSAWLGVKGSFIFSLILFIIASISLGIYFASNLELDRFFIFQLFLLPVAAYFVYWMIKVYKNPEAANYENTMRMNFIGSLFTNLGFLALILYDLF